jgi:predicted transcriptional regulator
MAKLAQIPGGVSFESLRWTSAVRDFKDGMSHDKLQVKMGLSKVTFRETLKKLEKLAKGEKE